MAHRDVLIEFFARYPSALGTTHAGGQYRLICPQCGEMVPVAVLDDDTRQIDIVCYTCGYEDHLADGVDGAPGVVELGQVSTLVHQRAEAVGS